MKRIKLFMIMLLIGIGTLVYVEAKAVQAQASDFAFDATLVPTSYQLNAMQPKELADFYRTILGLTLISQDEEVGYYELGTTSKEPLLEIFQATSERSHTTGLYHMAFVFENRQQLGALLRTLYSTGTAMQGFSYHITHEAIYLLDPEGNGLELYFDRPQDEWLNQDQSVTMDTQVFQAGDLLKNADATYEGMTAQTQIGHVHLNVRDIASTQAFYSDILPLHVTNRDDASATFLATGTYHHHLGANIWSGEQLPEPIEGQQGIRMINWLAKDQHIYYTIKHNLDNTDYDYVEDHATLVMKDNSGLLLSITVDN